MERVLNPGNQTSAVSARQTGHVRRYARWMALWVIALLLSAAGLARVSYLESLILVMAGPVVVAALVLAGLVPLVVLFLALRTALNAPRATGRWRALVVVASMAMAGPLLAAGTFAWLTATISGPAAIERFLVKRSTFERLASMLREDLRTGRIDGDFDPRAPMPSHERALGEVRLTQYRGLFDELDLRRIAFKEYGPDVIHFQHDERAIRRQTTEGFAMLCKGATNVVGNIDDAVIPDGTAMRVYQHIDGPWFLYALRKRCTNCSIQNYQADAGSGVRPALCD